MKYSTAMRICDILIVFSTLELFTIKALALDVDDDFAALGPFELGAFGNENLKDNVDVEERNDNLPDELQNEFSDIGAEDFSGGRRPNVGSNVLLEGNGIDPRTYLLNSVDLKLSDGGPTVHSGKRFENSLDENFNDNNSGAYAGNENLDGTLSDIDFSDNSETDSVGASFGDQRVSEGENFGNGDLQIENFSDDNSGNANFDHQSSATNFGNNGNLGGGLFDVDSENGNLGPGFLAKSLLDQNLGHGLPADENDIDTLPEENSLDDEFHGEIQPGYKIHSRKGGQHGRFRKGSPRRDVYSENEDSRGGFDGRRNDNINSGGRRNNNRNSGGRRNDNRNSGGRRNDDIKFGGRRNDDINSGGRRNDDINSGGRRNDDINSEERRNDNRNSGGRRNDNINSDGRRNDNRNSGGRRNDNSNSGRPFVRKPNRHRRNQRRPPNRQTRRNYERNYASPEESNEDFTSRLPGRNGDDGPFRGKYSREGDVNDNFHYNDIFI